ncbi:MAG: hypothetical protein ACO4B3_13640, partial [Planctomycetota bacterium]
MLRARRGIERWPIIGRYVHWLHGRWPAGAVEKLPEVRSDTSTRIPGLHIVGDLTGVPLLKSAADSGVIALRAVADALPAARGGELAVLGHRVGGEKLHRGGGGGGGGGGGQALEMRGGMGCGG